MLQLRQKSLSVTVENGRCAKSWGTGKCHSCLKLKKKAHLKSCTEVTLGDPGKNQNWFIKGIVHEKPGKIYCHRQKAAKFY